MSNAEKPPQTDASQAPGSPPAADPGSYPYDRPADGQAPGPAPTTETEAPWARMQELRPARERHDISVTVMAALLFPGAGQFYNGQVAKGILLLSIGLLGVVILVLNFSKIPIVLLLLGLEVVLWFVAIVEAGFVAGRLKRGETVGPWQWF